MFSKQLSNLFSLEIQKLQLLDWYVWIIVVINLDPVTSKCHPRSLFPGVSIAGSCGAREGEVCNAICTHKDSTLWQKQVQCLAGKWSPTPFCQGKPVVKSLEMVNCGNLPVKAKGTTFCMKITEQVKREKKCPEVLHLKVSLSSCTREVNSQCKVSCGNTDTMIKCLPDGTWSQVPHCRTLKQAVCPIPEKGSLLGCSRREGERCKMRCPDGKVMKQDIVCLPSGVWSLVSSGKTSNKEPSRNARGILSGCSCPPPNVTDELITMEDCSQKKIGQICRLGCKKHYAILGRRNIKCKKDLTWSSFPVCSDKTCPEPWLEEPLEFAEECAYKLSHETCQLRCGGFSKIVPKSAIKCINGTHWTQFPYCICNPPVLPDDTAAKENCQRKRVGMTCKLTCRGNRTISRMNYIMCQNNGSWTPVPRCQRNACMKPDLTRAAVTTKEDCSFKQIGDTCSLECLKVPETYEIVCLNNAHWSTYPKCSCPAPHFSANIQPEDDCSVKKPGEKCKVSCKNMPTTKESLFVECLSNSEWGNEPYCDETVCPIPKLPSILLFDEDCSHKRSGERCNLICKTGGKFVEEGYITCISGKKWSNFPRCACPKPHMDIDLVALEDCSFKTSGELCRVKCREQLSLSGQDFFICQNDTNWSDQPSCKRAHCPNREIPSHLRTNQGCEKKTVGGTCEVFCRTPGSSIIGPNIITCLDSLKWSPFPNCTCPEPHLPTDLQFSQSCPDMQPGSKCELHCQRHLKLMGNPFIQCLDNSTWSAFPRCSSGACSAPQMPKYVKTSENCLDKNPADTCEVSCKEKGVLHGSNIIICLNQTHWSDSPKCACPKPTLDRDLEPATECDALLPGEKCYLMCKQDTRMSRNNFITCGNNFEWSNLPNCNKKACQKPTLSSFLTDDGSCAFKEVGEECSLNCKEGGQIIGSSTIKCLDETTWSPEPDCGCAPLLLGDDLETAEDCTQKKRNDKCYLRCKNGLKLIGRNYTVCQNNTRWGFQPTCKIRLCSNPFLPEDILKPKEDCSAKIVGDKCAVKCAQGGSIIGSEIIECLNETDWSARPNCSCPEPNDLPDNLVTDVDCKNKTVGMQCKVSCKDFKKPVDGDTITCNEKAKWSSFPSCSISFCPKPLLPSYLKPLSDCSSISVNQFCELSCSGGGHIIGQKNITCLSNSSWSEFPKCTCPPLDSKGELSGNCSSVMPGSVCSVTCKNPHSIAQANVINCNNNSSWSDLSVCKKPPCNDLIFPDSSDYIGKCKNKSAGEYCYLRCKGRGVFVNGINHVMCKTDGQWTRPRRCKCRNLIILPGIRVTEKCDKKFRGDTCRIECRNGQDLKEQGFVTCDNSYSWTAPPSCKLEFCGAPELPQGLHTIEGNCAQLKIMTSCKLSCINKGVINGSDTVFCNAERKLSKIPICTCSKPLLPATVRSHDSCEGREINDSCTVHCVSQPAVPYHMVCLMQEKWMWTALPDCPCTPPTNLKKYVQVQEVCALDSIPVNTVCPLRCGNFGELVGGTSVTCLPGSLWSESPACACIPPVPLRQKTLLDLSQCERTLPGSNCRVSCRRGIINKDFMHCNASTYTWDTFPTCNCPDPRNELSAQDLDLDTACQNLTAFWPGVTCAFKCLNGGFYASPKTTRCRDNATWSATSAHCTCPPPNIPKNIFGFAPIEVDSCKDKFKDQNCSFVCLQPTQTIMLNASAMTCNKTYWTGELACYYQGGCTILKPQFPFRERETCERKINHEKCYLGIEQGYAFRNPEHSFAQCVDGKWILPEYDKLQARQQVSCPRAVVRDPLLLWPGDCVNGFVGQKCNLKCRNDAVFINYRAQVYAVECIQKSPSEGAWSSFPLCACANYAGDYGHRITRACDQKRPQERCDVYCFSARKWTTIVCNSFGQWSTPDCSPAQLTQRSEMYYGRKRRKRKRSSR